MWWESLIQRERSEVDYPETSFFIRSHHILAHAAPRRIDFIVIHITGGMLLGPVVNHFIGSETNTRGASAHYIIDRDGTIVQMVRDQNIAAHCANIGSPHNRLSIGIEHVCSSSAAITTNQYISSAGLVGWLCQRYGIPREHNMTPLSPGIRGHTEEYQSSGHRGCPNSVWDWEHYMRLLNAN